MRDEQAISPLPIDTPAGFETLFGLGEPLMLPPDFPVGEGLPAVHPYVMTAEPGEYEVSLDFGPECRGAGACHYGSLASKRVDASTPVGTRSYPFDAGQAETVTLAYGIQGYFVPSVRGANCSDGLFSVDRNRREESRGNQDAGPLINSLTIKLVKSIKSSR